MGQESFRIDKIPDKPQIVIRYPHHFYAKLLLFAFMYKCFQLKYDNTNTQSRI